MKSQGEKTETKFKAPSIIPDRIIDPAQTDCKQCVLENVLTYGTVWVI